MLTDQHMAQLWERMARIYLHRWTSGAGDADDGTWLTGLQALTPERLAHGLRQCIARGDPWPPTLPEFRGLCLDVPDEHHAIEAALHGWPDGDPIGGVAANMRRLAGSWDRSHLSERELRARYRGLYERCVRDHVEHVLGAEGSPALADEGAAGNGSWLLGRTS